MSELEVLMQYDSALLGQIRDYAMNLYLNHDVMPLSAIKEAMKHFGIPESEQWEVSQAIKTVGLVERPVPKKPPSRKKRNFHYIPSIDGKSRAAGER